MLRDQDLDDGRGASFRSYLLRELCLADSQSQIDAIFELGTGACDAGHQFRNCEFLEVTGRVDLLHASQC